MDISPDNNAFSPTREAAANSNEDDRNCNNTHAAEGIADVQEELQSRMLVDVGNIHIDIDAKLGHGAFSSVYRGEPSSSTMPMMVVNDADDGRQRCR